MCAWSLFYACAVNGPPNVAYRLSPDPIAFFQHTCFCEIKIKFFWRCCVSLCALAVLLSYVGKGSALRSVACFDQFWSGFRGPMERQRHNVFDFGFRSYSPRSTPFGQTWVEKGRLMSSEVEELTCQPSLITKSGAEPNLFTTPFHRQYLTM